jgi:lipopolysaccharide biosynthesis regulator YciM
MATMRVTLGVVYMVYGRDWWILYFGIAMLCLCPLIVLGGLYAEGKSKLIAIGRRWIFNELRPREYIKEYERLASTSDLVINKPSFEALQLLLVAYDSLNERERALAVADELILVASEKKKALARLFKVSLLFAYGMAEEGEELFLSVQSEKLDLVARGFVDNLYKSDRAIAMGDFRVAEMHNLSTLERASSQTPLVVLLAHFSLGEIYVKLGEAEKALVHLEYCTKNCGETAIGETAREILAGIQSLG